MKTMILILITTLIAEMAQAIEIQKCENWEKSMEFIVEPWADNTRTFHNGQSRIVYIDTLGEPVCCSSKILVFTPNRNADLGEPKCFSVNLHGSTGFVSIDFANIKASYEPQTGVIVDFGYQIYDPSGDFKMEKGRFAIDLNKETVKALK